MSVKVVYNGIEDFRILGPNDFKFHSELEGVEDLTFPRGVEVEVSKEVRDALLEKPHIYGNFANVPRGESVESAQAESQVESAPANAHNPENEAQNDVPDKAPAVSDEPSKAPAKSAKA